MTYFEIVLIVLGILLIFAEIFTAVGGGFVALLGGAFVFTGLFMAFLPPGSFQDMSAPEAGQVIWSAVLDTLLAGGIATIGVIAFVMAAPKLAVVQRMAAQDEIAGSSATAAEAEQSLVGAKGIVVAECRPSGSVSLNDGPPQSALAQHGHFLEAGTPVEVVGMRYGEVVVAAMQPEEGTAGEAGPESEAT